VSILESAIATVSPTWAAKRAAARAQLGRIRSLDFNATSKGRRGGADGWRSSGQDAATATDADVGELRRRARHARRNNPYWAQARRAIVGLVVGHGIRASVVGPNKRRAAAVMAAWNAWAESRESDATRKLNWYGLQALVMGAVVTDGECLVVRRQIEGRFALQILGGEYLSAANDRMLEGGAEIVGGVEVDKYGAAQAYHVYAEPPSRGTGRVVRIPASEVAHVYRVDQPNQVRGESWISPVYTRLTSWDDYEDAELMKQKVAACFGAVYSGVEPDKDTGYEPLEKLEPGMVEYLPAGATVSTISPPASAGLRDNAAITLHAVATGLGITYEALTGDYSGVNFSSGRLAHLQQGRNVREWQRDIMLEMLCERVFGWFLESYGLRHGDTESVNPNVGVYWTVQSRDLIDPEKENKANVTRVRAGFASWSDIVRENGRDPEQVAESLAEDKARFEKLGLILDIDPSKVSAQGQGSVNQKQEGENGGDSDGDKPAE
jgi:lambda family phage portal protein